ncbi:Abi family protein [Polaromonas sp. C04]|uniref:Abi family protein n=1 Tax=Polaromonas sp. C04 TaxID=1945857 RepID=UPI001185291C|nr:Abi family protein [Polaromonas sp. C04]
MEFCKPPLKVPEQIELLKKRGLTIEDESKAIRVLQHVNYYRLRAYWLPYEVAENDRPAPGEHAFRKGATFDRNSSTNTVVDDLTLLSQMSMT